MRQRDEGLTAGGARYLILLRNKFWTARLWLQRHTCVDLVQERPDAVVMHQATQPCPSEACDNRCVAPRQHLPSLARSYSFMGKPAAHQFDQPLLAYPLVVWGAGKFLRLKVVLGEGGA